MPAVSVEVYGKIFSVRKALINWKIGKLHNQEPRPLEEIILEVIFMSIEEIKAVDIRVAKRDELFSGEEIDRTACINM